MPEPTKACPRCPEKGRQPWSAFRLHTGRDYPVAWCRECEREYARERQARLRAADPGANAKALRKRYAAERSDPERMAVRLMKQRERHGIPPERWRGARLHRAKRTVATVPAGPFAEWLRTTIADHPHGIKGVALTTRIEERVLRRVIKGEQDNVSIDTVDRALLAEGTADIGDLYPLAA